MSVEDVTKDFIKEFLRKIDVKPQFKRSYKTYISTFYNWMIEEKRLKIVNTTIGIRLGKNLPVERHRIHSKTDISRIISYCDNKHDAVLKTIIYLIYGAQVRISEILKIQISDFKLSENKIQKVKVK